MPREIQSVLTRHFQSKLDEEADRLWDEGILNQEKLDEIRRTDLHAKEIDAHLYAKYGLTAEKINFIEAMIRPMG